MLILECQPKEFVLELDIFYAADASNENTEKNSD